MANEPNAPATVPVATQSNSSKLKSIVSVFNKNPKDVKDVVSNHNPEGRLSIITQSGGFSLADLERFIQDVKAFNGANGFENPGIGVYLFRENMDGYKLHKNESGGLIRAGESAGKSLSQISFVLIPIEFDARHGKIEKHYINETIDEIPAMIPSNEGTGLCPPSCK